MEKQQTTQPLVLAIAPIQRGIGYALFEGATEPIDWGVKEARIRKNAQGQKHVQYLINLYQPDILILRQPNDPADKHARRIGHLTETIARRARGQVTVKQYSQMQVKDVFSQFGATTKYGMARKIAEYLPALAPSLPQKRKAWMPQDAKEGIVDAVSLTLTHYYLTD